MESINDDDLARKKECYGLMEVATNESDDDVPDPGRQASVNAMRMAATPRMPKQRDPKSLSRSVSDNQVDGRVRQSGASKRPVKPPSPATLSSRHTFAGTQNVPSTRDVQKRSMVSKVTGKRKRKDDVERLPSGEGIFSSLDFYFFPNNDKHPARKLRITKAVEYGATWVRNYDQNVTHVIVDKSLDFAQLLKFVKKDSLPQNVVVVSEDYPAECISCRTLLDPRQAHFKVKGHIPASDAPPVSADFEKSLQLKTADTTVTARQPQTPGVDARSPSLPSEVPDDEEPPQETRPPPSIAPYLLLHGSETTNIHSTEEFDVAIKLARELQHMPLDPDDEPISRPSSSEGPQTDDEDEGSGLQLLKKQKTKFQSIQDRFQCMQKHTGPNTENPNANTIAILQQMADYYGQVGDEWRLRAYRKAIATLRNHPTKVWTRDEALALPQIGGRLATKIEEIAYTDRLRRLENTKAEPSDQVLQTFMQIYSVGFAQASKWVDAGLKTLDELLEKADLSDNQRIGLGHYEDFNSRIPRAEVEQHGSIVRKVLQKIDPAFKVIVGGSYRRGSDTSGDIDCIITRPQTGSALIRQIVLDQLVPTLFAKKFLVAELAATSRDDGSKWHGASQIPSADADGPRHPWRRIDFLLVPSDELGAALIYFTGNDIFNRSMRLLAGTKGMRLNQRGLYTDVIRGKGREKLSDGTLVEGKDEKAIFEILGVPWRPPEHRMC